MTQPSPPGTWIRITSISAEEVPRAMTQHVHSVLPDLKASVYRCVDGPVWLKPSGKQELCITFWMHGGDDVPEAKLTGFRAWFDIQLPVYAPAVAELPRPELTWVMYRHVIDALTSPLVVAKLGYPPLFPFHAPFMTELEWRQHFDLPTSREDVEARAAAKREAVQERIRSRKKDHQEP